MGLEIIILGILHSSLNTEVPQGGRSTAQTLWFVPTLCFTSQKSQLTTKSTAMFSIEKAMARAQAMTYAASQS